ncbi:MAG TPA: cell wall-binding repeat-containing protein, partial [Acidimicrobiales bacterium]|nr:cell wall-binding repeat-containing protein [Acidimicrobiales bacterium]
MKFLTATLCAVLLASTATTVPALAAETVSVERIAGADRYSTAAAVALDGWPNGSDVVLARGDDFPDGLAAAFLANPGPFPILLTDPNRLPAATLSALQELGTR